MSDASPEVRARELGWVPKAEFRGGEDRWVDAETFVKRGEEIMPLLKANNHRLQSEVDALKAQLGSAQAAIKESQESMSALIEHQTEATKAAVKETKDRLKVQLREARTTGDWEAVDLLEEQIDAVKQTESDMAAKKPKPTPAPTAAPVPKVDPEFESWAKDNPWFGKDKRRTALTLAVAQELRDDPSNKDLLGRAFFQKAAEEADSTLNPGQRASKVETSSGSSGSGGGGGGKGFDALPADAKAVCARQAERLVGKNRAFKDMKSWQAHYAAQYFAQE